MQFRQWLAKCSEMQYIWRAGEKSIPTETDSLKLRVGHSLDWL